MATKKTPTTTSPPAHPVTTSTADRPHDPAAYVPSPRKKKAAPQTAKRPATAPAEPKPTPATTALAARLQKCPEAKEVKTPEERGIAVRLKTSQLEIPMLVHVPVDDDGLVVFDLYPFRFVGIDAKGTDWLALIRLAGSGYVQLRLDQDLDDKDVLVYSFHMPLKSLTDDVTATTVATLTSFAEDNYDEVMAAAGLVEHAKR